TLRKYRLKIELLLAALTANVGLRRCGFDILVVAAVRAGDANRADGPMIRLAQIASGVSGRRRAGGWGKRVQVAENCGRQVFGSCPVFFGRSGSLCRAVEQAGNPTGGDRFAA